MKINSLSITSATALNFDLDVSAPVVFICGRYSDLAVDLLREIIGDYGVDRSPDRIDDGRFVIHSDIEMDGKDYSVCYIRNADFIGDNRLAVNFSTAGLDFSEKDTLEFLKKCKARNKDEFNVFEKTFDLSASADDRPIFIYDYFDHLDEAIDPTDVIDRLASLGRQVFVPVCSSYPAENLSCDNLQVLRI